MQACAYLPCSALHDAAEAGDLDVLGRLLHVLTAPLEDLDPQASPL